MKPAFLLLLLIGFVGVARAQDGDFDPKLLTQDKLIVVLGSFTDFKEAKTHAQSISRASGVPFSLEGKIYDKKRGLILPDNDPDNVYAGSYILRRHNLTQLDGHGDETEFLSIERSEAYPGLRRGYYIIVGGIYENTKDAAKALARFHLPAADAYAKKVQIYMGCMH